MQLNLTTDEAGTLRAFLHDTLPDLQREVAFTEAREMRRHLLKRQELCERILAELEQAGA
jgi:hypothetical protein